MYLQLHNTAMRSPASCVSRKAGKHPENDN